MVTSYAQAVLPEGISSFANSVSGWTILCALLVMLAHPRPLWGAVAGAASFVCLVLGYTLASDLRGYAYTPTFWLVVALVAGPVIGYAAASTRQPSAAAAAFGWLLIGGVLIADGLRGLTVLADTTSPVYWTVVVALGATAVAVAGLRLLPLLGRPRDAT